MAELAAIPERVRSAVAGRDAQALEPGPRSDAWSALDICKHVRDAAQVYGMRFKWIIRGDDPFLPNYDEDRWVADSPKGAAAKKDPEKAADIAAAACGAAIVTEAQESLRLPSPGS